MTDSITPTKPLVIYPNEVAKNALFLREGWVSGESADGTKVELERTTHTLIFTHTTAAGVVRKQIIQAGDLAQAWAAAIDSDPIVQPE